MIALVFISPIPAFAVSSGGFENATFSAKHLALSHAATATPDEPAAISYNPAGITELPGLQIQSNANFLSLFTFKESDTTGSTRSTGTLHFIPTAYMTANPENIFKDRVIFGFGVDIPFGLANKYSSTNPISHYTGYANWLTMYSLKPVIAIKPLNWLSLSAGPVWYRVDDFGGVEAYPNKLAAALLGTGKWDDGQLRVNTSGNDWGWQFGALVRIKEKHRLGYYFRSPVDLNLRGQAKIENTSSGNFETGAHVKLPLPMNMTWAYAYQPTKKTHVELDFGYTHWSTFERSYFNVDHVNTTEDLVINAMRQSDKDYNNAFTLHLGGSHQLTKKLTLYGGTAYYWTPVPKTSFSPAVPDANRLGFSLGTGYNISKNITADLCYYTVIYMRRRINNSISETLNAIPGGLPNSSVDGTYQSFLQGFSLSVTFHWDDLFKHRNPQPQQAEETQAPAINIQQPV